MQINEEAGKELDRLLDLNPEDLTHDDKVFLYARRDYLTNEQKRIFAEPLNEMESQVEVVEEEKVVAPKKNLKNK